MLSVQKFEWNETTSTNIPSTRMTLGVGYWSDVIGRHDNRKFGTKCRGICKSIKWKRTESPYLNGYRFCKKCDKFIDPSAEGAMIKGSKVICNCCKTKTRAQPRTSGVTFTQRVDRAACRV